MKTIRVLLGLGVLALAAAAAWAQQPDREAVRKKILEEVEKRIRQEEERILREIEKIIDEELARPRKPGPPEPPKPAAPPPAKTRGYLGIRAADLTAEEKKGLQVQGGFRILEVLPGSPAERGGLKVDDVVTAIDGRPVQAAEDVRSAVAAAGAGAELRLDVVRSGRKESLRVTLGCPPDEPGEKEPPPGGPKTEPKGKAPPAPDSFFALDEEVVEHLRKAFEPLGLDPDQFLEKGADGKYRLRGDFSEMFRDLKRRFGLDRAAGEPREGGPKEKSKPSSRPWLGIQVEELSEDLRHQLEIEEGTGLLVSEVLPGSPAEKAGLQRHDILIRIDDKPVRGEDSLLRFMEGARVGQEASLTVLRKSRPRTLKVVLGERPGKEKE